MKLCATISKSSKMWIILVFEKEQEIQWSWSEMWNVQAMNSEK